MFDDNDLYESVFGDDPFNDRSGARGFLARVVLAFASGMDAEELVEQEVRRMTCDWCWIGVPLNENGDHEILGIVLPCEYEVSDGDEP